MSGIITGPYFKQYFNSPGPIELGTMVAVLELGALGTFLFRFRAMLHTNIPKLRRLRLVVWATRLDGKGHSSLGPLSSPLVVLFRHLQQDSTS